MDKNPRSSHSLYWKSSSFGLRSLLTFQNRYLEVLDERTPLTESQMRTLRSDRIGMRGGIGRSRLQINSPDLSTHRWGRILLSLSDAVDKVLSGNSLVVPLIPGTFKELLPQPRPSIEVSK